MGTRLHINLYIYKTTSVPILVLLSQNAQSYPLAVVLCGVFWFQVSFTLSQSAKSLGEVDQPCDGRNFDFQYSNEFFNEAMNSSYRLIECFLVSDMMH